MLSRTTASTSIGTSTGTVVRLKARGLADGVNSGGGKVSGWTGTMPNHTGELIQLGVKPTSAPPARA